MSAYSTIIFIMFAHFVSDFIAQTDWMAQNKSKNWSALTWHVTVYTLLMVVQTVDLFTGHLLAFMAITFALHFVTDAITSRCTSYLYSRSRHWFFVMIGFDQFIHLVCLVKTYEYLR